MSDERKKRLSNIRNYSKTDKEDPELSLVWNAPVVHCNQRPIAKELSGTHATYENCRDVFEMTLTIVVTVEENDQIAQQIRSN
jgi:hypothetical protein